MLPDHINASELETAHDVITSDQKVICRLHRDPRYVSITIPLTHVCLLQPLSQKFIDLSFIVLNRFIIFSQISFLVNPSFGVFKNLLCYKFL